MTNLKQTFDDLLFDFALPFLETCNPQCRNGGTCVGNNICECPQDTFGPYCTRK